MITKYVPLEEGQNRYFLDVQKFFGQMEIKKYFVKIEKIKKQVVNVSFLNNPKYKSSYKIKDIKTWPISESEMKDKFIKKIDSNLERLNKELSYYTSEYPKLPEIKEDIKNLEFIKSNLDKIFSNEFSNLCIEFKKFQGWVEKSPNFWSKEK